jgi:hypothetical protein
VGFTKVLAAERGGSEKGQNEETAEESAHRNLRCGAVRPDRQGSRVMADRLVDAEGKATAKASRTVRGEVELQQGSFFGEGGHSQP